MPLTLAGNASGVSQYRFEVMAGGESVPGLLWRPQDTTKPELTILIGHGRTGDKRNPYGLAIARRLTARGWNAVAIDAPGHGERRTPGAGAEQEWPRPDPDQVNGDWQAAVGFLHDEGGLDISRLGYWGLSMGASLGISLIASDPRVKAAVLGLMHANWPAPPGTRIRADAASLTCPVLFLVNWDDRRAPRAQAFELFDLIGSTDKRLHAYPGDHGQLPDEALAATTDFLARYQASSP